MKLNTIELGKDTLMVGLINDWYDLSAATGAKAQTLSYALRNKKDLQRKIHIKDRIVYESAPSLKLVQEALMTLLIPLQDSLPTEQMLAYIKGKSPVKVLRDNCIGYKYEMKFDVRKCYDNITFKHIVTSLQNLGFTHMGAKLVARYCVVERRVSSNKSINTLQQGSPTSPVISNIVGYYFMDLPIMTWLEEQKKARPGLDIKYYRYSDNIVIFADGPLTDTFFKEYKAMCKKTLADGGFKTHMWKLLPANHPKQNQKFLGIVLNKVARVEKDVYDRLRAILFNCCTKGIAAEAERYYSIHPYNALDSGQIKNAIVQQELKIEKMLASVQGQVSYVSSINEKHGKALAKLMGAVKIIRAIDKENVVRRSNVNNIDVLSKVSSPNVFALLKQYKLHDVSVEDYLEAFTAELTSAEENVLLEILGLAS